MVTHIVTERFCPSGQPQKSPPENLQKRTRSDEKKIPLRKPFGPILGPNLGPIRRSFFSVTELLKSYESVMLKMWFFYTPIRVLSTFMPPTWGPKRLPDGSEIAWRTVLNPRASLELVRSRFGPVLAPHLRPENPPGSSGQTRKSLPQNF